ncbi:ketoacyl-synt-domain-containing protein [Pilatotrama ljubarskyi]|nr:ketoacyl-synt-domain-containing protein [Pilatotrama ljubarskyi]
MSTSPVEIAIVGIAAELPSGACNDTNLDHRSFFRFLLEGREAYERIPLERFNIHGLVGSGLGKCATETGTFLKHVHHFDHLEFGVTSKDARMMPLSTRKLIEVAFLSLLDSGIDYRGRNVGCYTAGVAFDMFSISGHDDDEARGSFASGPAMVANRVSYYLDLRGPSIPIDTACSSSLTATHMAVQAIVHGECEAAVVGGSQINHRFSDWLSYSQGGVLSPDGKCKPFDTSADGFGRGEGVVGIVLKPLHAALRDGDRVYATILGTGINSSGSLAPVNAPVASAQREAMQRAFAQAARDPRHVDFLELHATGTATGDPTEANWVGEEFSRDDELVIGSVKGNIGHLEITAFLASLCKVCSIFETGVVPPNANFKTPNPAIKWKQFKMRVPVEPERLVVHSPSGRALVAMTSSGIGGSNAHCVVEGPPLIPPKASSFWSVMSGTPLLLIAGGLSPRSAAAVCDSISERWPLWTGNIHEAAAREFGRRARSMTWRSFAIKNDGVLGKFGDPILAPKTRPSIVFVFSGQGPQYYAMGRELFQSCLVFRKSILQLDRIYQSVLGESLLELTGLFDEARHSDPLGDIWPIAVTIVSLTMLQIALFDTLAALGIRPDVLLGHSAGETPLLYASGAGSRALAMELAIARGKAMSLMERENGTMAALSCSSGRAAELIAEIVAELGPGVLDVGCYNAPGAVTLSGHARHIDEAVKKASEAGIFARRLRTRIPVHSAMMDLCAQEYQILVGDVFSRYRVDQPTVETWSTKTGTLLESAYDAQYFWDNTRGPVNFSDALQGIAQHHPHAIYVELGPHPVLASYISSMAGKSAVVTCPLRRAKAPEKRPVEVASLLETMGKLFVSGYTRLDFDVLYGTSRVPPDALPAFPFAHKDVPYTAPTAEIARQRQRRNGPLNYHQLQLNDKTHPELAEHVIKNEPILSTAGYMEMALEFGAWKLYNVELVSILSLSAKRPTPVEVCLDGSRWSVLSAATVDYTKTWPMKYNRVHAKGHLCMQPDPDDVRTGRDISGISSRLQPVNMIGFYDAFRSFADYGPSYQRVLACSYARDRDTGRDEWLVKIRGADTDIPDIADYRIHPAILDASLHILVHPVVTGVNDPSQYYLPSRVGALVLHEALLHRPFPPTLYVHATFKTWTPTTLIYDLLISTEDGTPLYSVDELEISMHGRTVAPVGSRYEVVYLRAPYSIVVPLADGVEPLVIWTAPAQGQLTPHLESADSDYAAVRSEAGVGKTIGAQLRYHEGSSTATWILGYKRGAEMNLKRIIQEYSTSRDLSLWLHASAGVDGDALVGFARTLRKEFLSWSTHALVFDSSWSEDDACRISKSLSRDRGVEEEVFVEADGSISVPRIIQASSPPSQTIFQPSSPWKYEKSSIIQTSLPSAGSEDQVLVRITGAAIGTQQLWSFIGHRGQDGSSRLVAGVAFGPLANFIVAHQFALVELPPDSQNHVLSIALPAAIAALAVGLAAFSRRECLRKQTIVVTHADTTIGAQVAKVYCTLGADVISLPSQYTVSALKEVFLRRPQLIVSASQDESEAKTFRDIVSPTGRVFLWDHSEHGIAHIIQTDPCSVGEAVRAALPYVCASANRESLIPPLELITSVVPDVVPLATNIFEATKSYVLLGGVGSLGLKLAHWMYEKGARELLLTSRSGRRSLLQKGDYTAIRYLDYLEALPHLHLSVACTGDSPLETFRGAVQSLSLPVGGCFLLSGVLVDRPFMSQTPETFEAPFEAKVDAFKLVEKVLPVEELDFLVTFSSVSGMFGNSGQTNYASANTSLAGLTKKYRNAVCIVAPAILDTSTIKGELFGSVSAVHLKHLTEWGLTSTEFFSYVEDAIRCVASRPVWQYIPAFDWQLVQANMGSSALYDHLVPARSSSEDLVMVDNTPASSTVHDVVCKVLDLSPEDLSLDVPFTSYGLDSLSAAVLSHALRPFLAISQLQLLADVTMRELEARIGA